jgi:hypothetical protein
LKSSSPSTSQSIQQQAQLSQPKENILFNHDDKLDHLRSQSPPQQQMQPDKSSSQTKKHTLHQPSNISSVRDALDDNLANQSMMQSLQQLIQDQIEQGVTKLVTHNQQQMQTQQRELSQLLHQSLNQSQSGLLQLPPSSE